MSVAGAILIIGSLTHVGMRRSGNEDAYCVLEGPKAPLGTDALLAVADGMGGHQAGEVASNMAIEGLTYRILGEGDGDATLPGVKNYEGLLERVIKQINTEVYQAGIGTGTQGMGTTLTVALVTGQTLVMGHVGDSRGYIFRKGQLGQFTQDHSWVAEEISRGALTPEQAMEHPQRNILTRALGPEAEVRVDHGSVSLEEGDVLLLCSDGLHSLVTDKEIGEVLSQNEPQAACDMLVERANALGGHDNITVIVGRVEKLTGRARSPGSGRARDQMTTLQLRTPGSTSSAGNKVLRLVMMPLRPFRWIITRCLALLGRSSK